MFSVITPPFLSDCRSALEARVADALENRARFSLGSPPDFRVRLRVIEDNEECFGPDRTKTVANTAVRGEYYGLSFGRGVSQVSLFAASALSYKDCVKELCERIRSFYRAARGLGGHVRAHDTDCLISYGARVMDEIDRRARRCPRWPARRESHLRSKDTLMAGLPRARSDLRSLASQVLCFLSESEDVFAIHHEIDHVYFACTPAHFALEGDFRREYLEEARATCVGYTLRADDRAARRDASERMREEVMCFYAEDDAHKRMYRSRHGHISAQMILASARRAVNATAHAYIRKPSRLEKAAREATSFDHYCRICEAS